MGFATNYAYDQVGQRIAVTDAQRRTTQYVYDAAHRLVQERRPDGVILDYTYDLANRLLTATNGRGQTTGYRYDQRNNLVEMNYPSGKSVRFEYDAVGRQTSMTDWVGITRYRYNQMGWLEQVEGPLGTSLEYSYDLAGNRTDMRLRYFGNTYLWTYAYDAANRLTSLQSPGVAKANTFTYNAVNLPTRATYANNATVNYTYDYARQLKSINSSGTTGGTDPYGNALPGVSTMSYTYDKAGRRTYYGGNGNQYYQYDAGSRLTASGPSSSATERPGEPPHRRVRPHRQQTGRRQVSPELHVRCRWQPDPGREGWQRGPSRGRRHRSHSGAVHPHALRATGQPMAQRRDLLVPPGWSRFDRGPHRRVRQSPEPLQL